VRAVQRVWKLARLRHRNKLQPEFWIGHNKLGIPLPCPQILRLNGVQSWRKPRSASSSMARPLPAKPKKMRTQENAAIGAPGQISILLRRRRSESE
jgi:hypothetical protein